MNEELANLFIEFLVAVEYESNSPIIGVKAQQLRAKIEQMLAVGQEEE